MSYYVWSSLETFKSLMDDCIEQNEEAYHDEYITHEDFILMDDFFKKIRNFTETCLDNTFIERVKNMINRLEIS